MYDYLRRLWENREKALTVIFIGAFLLLAGIWFHYCLCIRNVPDHGGGADSVGNQLTETGTAIQHAKDVIDQAQGTAGAVAETVADAQGTAEYLSGTVNDSAELIADCQRIIEAVRRRGKEKAPQN